MSEAFLKINDNNIPINATEEIQSMEVDNATPTLQPAPTKWTKKTKKRLLVLYLNYLRAHKGQEINIIEMWNEIASKLPNKTPLSCRKILAKLQKNMLKIDNLEEVKKKTPYYAVLEKILAIKSKFAKRNVNKDGSLKKAKGFSDVPLSKQKVLDVLEYYLEHLEEFLSPRYEKKKVWIEFAKKVEEPMIIIYKKVMFLKNLYNKKEKENNDEEIPRIHLLEKIFEKQKLIKDQIAVEKQVTLKENANEEANEIWNDNEIEKLLLWYLDNLDKFKNPKFVRSYLWQEASEILYKSPLACSKKMAEIRTQYRTMVRETTHALKDWRFTALCQKIYGTGKRSDSSNGNVSDVTA